MVLEMIVELLGIIYNRPRDLEGKFEPEFRLALWLLVGVVVRWKDIFWIVRTTRSTAETTSS